MSEKLINRIGIFFLSDKNGIVDSYIDYLLKCIKPYLNRLIVASKANFDARGVELINAYADEVVFFPEVEFAVQAYQRVFMDKLETLELQAYDEVVLFDDSFFGPIYPLEDMFAKMASEHNDFWGITSVQCCIGEFEGQLEKVLEDYFVVIGSDLLHSDCFRHYWGTYNADKAVEGTLTRYFDKAGFRWNVYIDTSAYDTERSENICVCSEVLTYELVSRKQLPFVKCKVFAECKNALGYSIRENAGMVMDYIKRESEFNVDLIWNHLLRVYNIADLKEAMHLNYVLPYSGTVHKQTVTDSKKCAVFIHLYYQELIVECFSYIKNIPSEFDIIVTTKAGENEELIAEQFKKLARDNYKILKAGTRGRDIASLLVICREFFFDYDYVCFIHDKKTSGNAGSLTVGKSFMYTVWDNLLKSTAYIKNIICLFEENPRLGFLTPPEPYHADYFYTVGNEWVNCYDKTVELMKRLNLKCPLSPDKQPFSASSTFWCRTAALQGLLEYPFSVEDFPPEPLPMGGTISHAIERIFTYVAQSEGYFSGIIENNEFASLNITNLRYMLADVLGNLNDKVYFTSMNDLRRELQSGTIGCFCKRYKAIYIYGAGDYGNRLAKVLQSYPVNLCGFIISDGQTMPDKLAYPCFYLSQLKPQSDAGIIIAANKRAHSEILAGLRARGFGNIL